jgi:hypothetical protein
MSISRQVLAPGAGVQAARVLFMVPVRMVQTPMGRRIMAAGALIMALQGAIGLMYSNADSPALSTSAPVAASAPAKAAAGAARPATVKPAATPESAAVAWYAARHKLDPAKVRPLQRDSFGAGAARVLVMADLGKGRLDTALVTVKQTKAGWAPK